MESRWWQTVLRMLACETKRFDLVTPRRRAECVQLLRENINPEWTLFGPHVISGRVEEATFNLRKRSAYNIQLQTIVCGEFVEESRQTRLACLSGPHRVFLGLHIVPLVAATLFAGAFTLVAIGSLISRGPLAGTVPLLGLTISFLVLVLASRWSASNASSRETRSAF
jgi:hypothetical protein